MFKDKGRLYIVGTPIGNLEDITLRALRILKEVHIIAAEDTRQLQKILNKYEIKNRYMSYHQHNEVPQGKKIIKELLSGKDIALVSDAGTPGISDPGYRLVNLAISEGIEIISIPGPSALIASLSISGLPTDSFFFAGFLPAKKGERLKKLQAYKDYPATLIFYESPHRLLKSLQVILEALGNRQIVIARELTKVYEEVIRGTLPEVISGLKDKVIKGEITILIEGKKAKTSKEEASFNMQEHFDELCKQGVSDKEAMKQIAGQLGISKSEVYRELLRRKNILNQGK